MTQSDIESPMSTVELKLRLDQEQPDMMRAVETFNDLHYSLRGYFNSCDSCSRLVLYTGGTFMDTGRRRTPGTRRWCCFSCAHACICGEWLHPANVNSRVHKKCRHKV